MSHVVATAGHVDHGKSALVRALTGMEPDRLAEERRRGRSIELGYAWTALPGVGEVGLVDVPGHRRLVRTALAGLGPVPVVLFVVAADEGWAPQSAEHLAALDALGVEHGVLVVTKIDRADPGSALAQARAALAGSALDGAPAVSVSARTGAGLEELRRLLAGVLAAGPVPAAAAAVRLWVDRSFTVAGTGCVVTGTLPAGIVAVGDELADARGRTYRVRGLQTHSRAVGSVSGTARVALALRGRVELARGDVLLTPGSHLEVTEFDAEVRGDADQIGATAVLHVGSAAVPGRLRRLGDRHVRLHLSRPVPLRIGDRAIVRDPGRPQALIGLSVLDVRPPALAGSGAAARRGADLARLCTVADVAAHLVAARPHRVEELCAMGLPADVGIEVAAGWRVGAACRDALATRLADLVAADLRADPLGRPRTIRSAAQALALDAALIHPLARAAGVCERNGTLRPAAEAASRSRDVQARLARLADRVAQRPFEAPSAHELAGLGLDERALAAADRDGLVLRLAARVVVGPRADETAVEVLAALPDPFRVSDVCAALGTTRRTAVPLLERLDRTGRTRRLPDGRRTLVRSSGSGALPSPDVIRPGCRGDHFV